jgi:Flp pilus assembly protein TadD
LDTTPRNSTREWCAEAKPAVTFRGPGWLDEIDRRLRDAPGWAPLIISLLTIAVYWASLGNGFVHLDTYQVTANPLVTRKDLWPHIFTGAIWSFLGGAPGNYYRPLHYFSYWIIYHGAGPRPAAFHLFQVLLYAATAVVVWRLGRELIGSELGGLLGAVLWILHPQHVEPVAWISALPEVGCGFFYLLAFWLFLKAEKTKSLTGHAVAALVFFPALLFKEMALSLPLLILAYWVFRGKNGERWLSRTVRWIPYLAAAAVYSAIRLRVLGHFTATGPLWGAAIPVWITGVRLLAEHTRLFFWPTHLTSFRVVDLRGGLRWWPLAALAGLAAGLWLYRRRPALGFLLCWWPLTLLPCLDVRQLTFPLVADRLSYLPSAGLCWAIAYGLLELRFQSRAGWLRAGLVAGSALAISCFWLVQTVVAIPRWHDNQTLVDYSLRQSPNVALLHVLKGVALAGRGGDLQAARLEYQAALRLNAASERPMRTVDYESYVALGSMAEQEGRRDEARSDFEKATQVPVPYSVAYRDLALLDAAEGDYTHAAEALARAVTVNPQDLDARFDLGVCAMKLRRYLEAAEQFRAVVQADPDYPRALEAEAQALEAAGDEAGAIRVRNGAASEQK